MLLARVGIDLLDMEILERKIGPGQYWHINCVAKTYAIR